MKGSIVSPRYVLVLWKELALALLKLITALIELISSISVLKYRCSLPLMSVVQMTHALNFHHL
jgi:hypothetical protein